MDEILDPTASSVPLLVSSSWLTMDDEEDEEDEDDVEFNCVVDG